MSELAFNANGDNFEIPAIVTGWRVRRLKPRGAPELVYGRDGRPLTVPIESDMDDLRDAVGGILGRYRLDPINEDGKIIDAVPAAYIQVVKAERALEAVSGPAPRDDGDSVIREAMRLNTELAKSVIDRFPEMMQAAAELLRAADGAGLPARQPREVDEQDDDDEESEVPPVASPGFELINNLVAQVIPIVVTSLAGKKMPNLASVLDWRKAAAEGQQKQQQTPALDVTTAGDAAVGTSEALPPLDPKTMSHFIAIQSALAPNEAGLARQVAAELSPAELRAWFHELTAMSVPEAVAKIRTMLGSTAKTGGAS
jgi:hypothetical protein